VTQITSTEIVYLAGDGVHYKLITGTTVPYTHDGTDTPNMTYFEEVSYKTTSDKLENLQDNHMKYTRFPIRHGAGLMDFGITNGTDVMWELADGTISYSTRPAKTLPSGVSYLYASNLYANSVQISDNGTDSNYTGDLSDLPALTNHLNLYNCTNVTGDLSDLPALTNTLSLYNCTNVTGILSPTATLKNIYLQGTGMTSNDTDQTLINLMNITTVESGGMLQIKANRTSASDEAFTYLSSRFTITEV
jgi:hypothetical protein